MYRDGWCPEDSSNLRPGIRTLIVLPAQLLSMIREFPGWLQAASYSVFLERQREPVRDLTL